MFRWAIKLETKSYCVVTRVLYFEYFWLKFGILIWNSTEKRIKTICRKANATFGFVTIGMVRFCKIVFSWSITRIAYKIKIQEFFIFFNFIYIFFFFDIQKGAATINRDREYSLVMRKSIRIRTIRTQIMYITKISSQVLLNSNSLKSKNICLSLDSVNFCT